MNGCGSPLLIHLFIYLSPLIKQAACSMNLVRNSREREKHDNIQINFD